MVMAPVAVFHRRSPWFTSLSAIVLHGGSRSVGVSGMQYEPFSERHPAFGVIIFNARRAGGFRRMPSGRPQATKRPRCLSAGEFEAVLSEMVSAKQSAAPSGFD